MNNYDQEIEKKYHPENFEDVSDDTAYPTWVCDACGLEANRLTCLEKYGAEPLKAKFDISTYHIGTCEVCGERNQVTEPRDFFYPNFDLLP